MTTEEKIQKQLAENPIILYMKGVPENPECGFSAKTVAALKETGVTFSYVNVLTAPFIREKLPKISHWPTYPQLFVNAELIGGCDIVEALAEDGMLLPALKAAVPIQTKASESTVISHAEVKQLIKKRYPDGEILIQGEGCDLLITIISEQFENLSMVKQQQGVMATLTEPLGNGRLHAVTLKTFTPTQWQEKQQSTMNPALLQIQL